MERKVSKQKRKSKKGREGRMTMEETNGEKTAENALNMVIHKPSKESTFRKHSHL